MRKDYYPDNQRRVKCCFNCKHMKSAECEITDTPSLDYVCDDYEFDRSILKKSEADNYVINEGKKHDY